MLSTMQDQPLLISGILRHGQHVYGDSEVITVEPDGDKVVTFTQVGEGAERLAKALGRLGVQPGDRVATFCWNNRAHLEAYFAVPSMGAVLHTLNLRLFPEQLAYVINHAADKVLLIDASVAFLFERIQDQCPTIEHFIVVGDGETNLPGALRYEELLAAETPGYDWPVFDERQASSLCYTSGTTGDPKGVAYSHRSTWLHSLAVIGANTVGLSERDRVLAIVPMFHVNAWGAPYAAFFAGSDLILPERFLQAAPLARMCKELRPTVSFGVPTIWNDLLQYSANNEVDMSSLRLLTVGGSAVPRTMLEQFDERFGVEMLQGWGMTETSPMCALARPPKGIPPEEEIDWRAQTGRVVAGVELRIVDESGETLPADGVSVGEFEVRGPWVTASYYKDPDPQRFQDGWLRTGDVGSLDARGFMRISDRTKDVIKTGGEWISSVELENEVMADPSIFEAAVIGVPDDKWGERPLVVAVAAEGASPDPSAVLEFLEPRVSRWWLPERWAFLPEIPKTSVGKFNKKALRSLVADGTITVQQVPLPPQS
jgi:fatty-acyl-CoA synthase